MTTLLLLRHGRSTSNVAGTLAGRTPGIDLDETGRSQAMRAGERLRSVPLAAAVRSPLERCGQTLDLALASAGATVPVHIDERVNECDYGQWSNRTLAELATEPLWATVQRHPSKAAFPGGESMQQMRSRMIEAVTDWNARLADDAIWLLVGHGDPIKAVLSHALGQPFDHFQRLVVNPASISIVQFPEQGAPLVIAMNSTHGQLRELGAPLGPQLGGGLGAQPEDDESTDPEAR